jgi:hypothetical protein
MVGQKMVVQNIQHNASKAPILRLHQLLALMYDGVRICKKINLLVQFQSLQDGWTVTF